MLASTVNNDAVENMLMLLLCSGAKYICESFAVVAAMPEQALLLAATAASIVLMLQSHALALPAASERAAGSDRWISVLLLFGQPDLLASQPQPRLPNPGPEPKSCRMSLGPTEA
ncbi:uncharacterized protein CTHT_0025880 [Thermochaetoides thermophila DSM 1495]|uniref:Uncharacterized protein n=1 Tax=Chaetomium thermophilum (strain DSM 1495 / CBS 144.50 / IMI 039719) TaxID=759272 RepID=G0S688_CHATD|nr:hypothetical protein CTHT_0025880 [Thermochaetoides thermophila DSM 1495]EGS20752.1 hypothetical protein CTHT_0025880 [Thermochaetoides thermophila DSM 1495]